LVTGRGNIDDHKMSTEKWEDNEEINIFREYLRIATVQPNVDYSKDSPKDL